MAPRTVSPRVVRRWTNGTMTAAAPPRPLPRLTGRGSGGVAVIPLSVVVALLSIGRGRLRWRGSRRRRRLPLRAPFGAESDFEMMTTTTTMHAWFSAETALRKGSSLFRKPDRSTVNVTRVSVEKDRKGGGFPHDEKYLGEVIGAEDGGCVRGLLRVPGISS